MPVFQPDGAVTGPDAPTAEGTPTSPLTLPEKPSTPPQGVSAESTPEVAPEADPQPDLLAGKFKTQDDLVKAYKELEAKLGQKQPDTQPDTQIEKAPEDAPQGTLDLAPFVAEFQRDGKLGDESYKHLAKLGLGKEVVDTYIAGREAANQQFVSEVTAPVGGPEGYQAMVEWAADNLSAPEIVSFNQAVVSGDRGLAQMAINGLAARYQAAEGKAPNLIAGGGHAKQGGYESVEQMKADMRDERYLRGDKAFHSMVDRKLAATTAF